MKRSLRFCSCLCLTAFIVFRAAAHAESFTFVATGAFFNASGTLTAVPDPTRPNVFDVTGISGTLNGNTITGLLPCAAYDPGNPCVSSGNEFFYDNLLYLRGIPTGVHQVLDYSGNGCTEANANFAANFAASNLHQYIYLTNAPHDHGTIIGFTLTPEPASLVLLGTGLLGLGGTLYRRLGS